MKGAFVRACMRVSRSLAGGRAVVTSSLRHIYVTRVFVSPCVPLSVTFSARVLKPTGLAIYVIRRCDYRACVPALKEGRCDGFRATN